MSIKKAVVILAGGLGSRYQRLKQIDGILENGSPIMEYSIYDAIQSGFTKFIFIINKKIPASFLDRINSIFLNKGLEIHWVYQELNSALPKDLNLSNRTKPWGTAHAVLCAKNYIQEPFIVLNADDFYGKITFQKAAFLMDNHYIDERNMSLLAYPVKNTLSENGTVSRGVCSIANEGFLMKIEEKTKIENKNTEIGYWENEAFHPLNSNTLVSMNFWILHPSIFPYFQEFFDDFISYYQDQQEFYIPTAIQKMINEKGIKIFVKASPANWMGVTYPDDKAVVQQLLRKEIENNQYPEQLWNI